MACILLTICSIGLITAYVVLIYNMRKYFADQMKNEMCRLTFLFATFVLAYLFRSLYQIGLMTNVFRKMINKLTFRYQLIYTLPIIWDLASIVSILFLHYFSFNQKKQNSQRSGSRVPRAGHYRSVSAFPDFETQTAISEDSNHT